MIVQIREISWKISRLIGKFYSSATDNGLKLIYNNIDLHLYKKIWI